jgi:hypothetical protein
VTRQALRLCPPIPRELRCHGQQRELRVAAGRERETRASHARPAGGGNPPPRIGPLTSPADCRTASASSPARSTDATHLSFLQGAGHGGSHPHLAHNFLMAVQGKQPAFPDAPTSANWTCVGICAHESAMKGGERSRAAELRLKGLRVFRKARRFPPGHFQKHLTASWAQGGVSRNRRLRRQRRVQASRQPRATRCK